LTRTRPWVGLIIAFPEPIFLAGWAESSFTIREVEGEPSRKGRPFIVESLY
jgi:hypothetical protein